MNFCGFRLCKSNCFVWVHQLSKFRWFLLFAVSICAGSDEIYSFLSVIHEKISENFQMKTNDFIEMKRFYHYPLPKLKFESKCKLTMWNERFTRLWVYGSMSLWANKTKETKNRYSTRKTKYKTKHQLWRRHGRRYGINWSWHCNCGLLISIFVPSFDYKLHQQVKLSCTYTM